MDNLPSPQDTSISLHNPRRRDGKPVHYLAPEAATIIFPWTRITFIEVMSGEGAETEVVEFYRD